MSRAYWIAFAIGIQLALLATPRGQADEPLSAQLSHRILTERQSLEEVREFVRPRIAAVPAATNAAQWLENAEATRQAVLDKVVLRGLAAEWREMPLKVEKVAELAGGPGYKLEKIRLEVIPDLWVPAVVYVPENLDAQVPVFLNVNGHDGTGKAAEYKQARCIHMAKNGVIALNLEWFGMGQLATPGFAHGRMNQLDLCGTSGLAPFYLAMSRSLDYLLSLENADAERVGVAGLSGGGWQTILISSLDPRVTLCNPVAGYSSFRTRIDHGSDLGDSEQTPVDLARTADYAHLTAMLAPRAALLTYNDKDQCCFAAGHALAPLEDAAAPVYRLLGQESRFRTHINSDPGTHNFLLDNRQALYRMIRDQWYQGDESAFATTEAPADDEIKSPDELQVPLPEQNLDFQSLALALADALPGAAPRPSDASQVEAWRAEQTQRLTSVVRPIPDEALAERMSSESVDDVRVIHWKLKVGDHWHVPAVDFRPSESAESGAAKVAIVLGDTGRAHAGEHVSRLLKDGYRVLAVDLFYFGESAVAEQAYLWALLISSVGERPLGVQTGQLLAVTKWLRDNVADGRIRIVADGPRSGLIALIASALDPELNCEVEEHHPLESLKQVISENTSFEQAPEQFCFGLLEATDIANLRALSAR